MSKDADIFTARSLGDAKVRVLHAYRRWLRSVRRTHLKNKQYCAHTRLQAPEVQTMYSLNMPVSKMRTKMRQEFERHRYVNKLPVIDMLLAQNSMEYQVRCDHPGSLPG